MKADFETDIIPQDSFQIIQLSDYQDLAKAVVKRCVGGLGWREGHCSGGATGAFRRVCPCVPASGRKRV